MTPLRPGGTYWIAVRTKVIEVRLAHVLTGEDRPTPIAVCDVVSSGKTISVPPAALCANLQDAEAIAAFTAFAGRRP